MQREVYILLIIPQKKSDFIVLTWDLVKERFLTPSQLKQRLSEFPRVLRKSAKCWIVSKEDIKAMDYAYFEGDVITIWCDGKTRIQKQKKDADETDTPLPKREECKCQQKKIYDELKKNLQTPHQ